MGSVTDAARDQESARRRKRRLAEVFGEVLPATTADEREAREDSGGTPDRWYRENRPPHYE